MEFIPLPGPSAVVRIKIDLFSYLMGHNFISLEYTPSYTLQWEQASEIYRMRLT